MMRLVVVCVRDRAVNAFMTPQFVIAQGAAIRGFADAINNKDTEFGKHPEDFDLFELGFYTDDGLFECGVPRQLAIGKDLVRS